MTRRRVRALLLGYPLVELITIYLVAQWIGWPWTLLLLLLGLPVGWAIMRNAGTAAMAELQQQSTTGVPIDPTRHAVTLLGGLLIAVPGFWTDLLGLLLVFAPTQRLVRSRLGPWVNARLQGLRMPGVYTAGFGGDVIQGTVVTVEDLRDEPPPAPPALP